MQWETLPGLFWTIYYLVLLLSIGSAIFSLYRKRLIPFALITIIVSVTVPFVALFYSIERSYGVNEFEHLFHQLQQGAIWSMYVSLGYLYLLAWWVLFFASHFSRGRSRDGKRSY